MSDEQIDEQTEVERLRAIIAKQSQIIEQQRHVIEQARHAQDERNRIFQKLQSLAVSTMTEDRELLLLAAEELFLVADEEEARTLTAKRIIDKFYRRRRFNPNLKFIQHLRDLGQQDREGYIRKVKTAVDKQRRKGNAG